MAHEGDVHMDANFDSTTMGEEGCESASNILTLLRKLKETIETSPQVDSDVDNFSKRGCSIYTYGFCS